MAKEPKEPRGYRFPILSALINRRFDALCQVVREILDLVKEKKKKPRFEYKIGLVENKNERTTMLELKITNEQKIKVTLKPVTQTGNPAPVDGAPTWTVQTGNSTVVPDADGMSAYLVASDSPGDTVVLVEADADVGEGTETIADTVRLTVEGAKAASLGLSAGDPEPK